MNWTHCRNCQYKLIDACNHPECQGARAQGFCAPGCRETYYKIKDKTLEMERKLA